MAYSGNTYSNRVDTTTERKLHGKVVDQVLAGRTYISRLMRRAKPLVGKTMDITAKITVIKTFLMFVKLVSVSVIFIVYPERSRRAFLTTSSSSLENSYFPLLPFVTSFANTLVPDLECKLVITNPFPLLSKNVTAKL